MEWRSIHQAGLVLIPSETFYVFDTCHLFFIGIYFVSWRYSLPFEGCRLCGLTIDISSALAHFPCKQAPVVLWPVVHFLQISSEVSLDV